jgi:hypothetical protein
LPLRSAVSACSAVNLLARIRRIDHRIVENAE